MNFGEFLMHIAILTPSRGRPFGLRNLVQTVVRHSSGNNKVSFEHYIDYDDPFYPKYVEELKGFEDVGSRITLGPSQSVSKSWNDIAKIAINNGADILMMGNDDLIFNTSDWDNILVEETKKFPDKIYCMWFNDGINDGKHCAFPIVSSLWFNTVGHFSPGIFNFLYNDTWIFDIAKRIGRDHYIPQVTAEHLHFSTGKSKKDKTTKRYRGLTKVFSKLNKTHIFEKDKVIFQNTVSLRIEAAEKLKKVMS